ncbi:hypothetical protein B0T20DRAFT_470512 [Sordaria brevicollis]|uniref:Uncharacterized protein n=1 Tax=Sordaria brevicollis TaxID=83679 RepID=A0AAE0PBM4_SORBR|nr:hypothetical protein B0T20DRAFT_470512 [Sordaria brevicollis]
MLPPIDSSILENNPQFANLYKGLTELLLNEDGSTKLPPNNPVAQERKAVTDELNKYRLKAAEETLLIHALSTTSPDPKPIPEEPSQPNLTSPAIPGGLGVQRRFDTSRLRQTQSQPPLPPTVPNHLKQPLTDLLLLLPSFLSLDFSSPDPPLDLESLTLLLTSPPISQLPILLPYLSPLLSATLHSHATHLCNLARLSHPSITTSLPSTTPTNRLLTQLPTKISTLVSSTLPQLHSHLLKSRLATAEQLRSLLSSYTTAISQLIKTLEAKHGPIARSLEFKASETSLLAQKSQLEAELSLLGVKKEVYTPEVRKALQNCGEWMANEKRRVEGEIERGRGLLRGYGVGVGVGEGDEGDREGDREKEKVMREIARVYGEMEREVDVVRRDLERLGG